MFFNPDLRFLDDLSGPWRCRWVQGEHVGLEVFSLNILNGGMYGRGSDQDGGFLYAGHIRADTTIKFVKMYDPGLPVPESISYIGQWNGRSIFGEWSDDACPEGNRGTFSMWPGEGPEPWPGAELPAQGIYTQEAIASAMRDHPGLTYEEAKAEAEADGF